MHACMSLHTAGWACSWGSRAPRAQLQVSDAADGDAWGAVSAGGSDGGHAAASQTRAQDEDSDGRDSSRVWVFRDVAFQDVVFKMRF